MLEFEEIKNTKKSGKTYCTTREGKSFLVNTDEKMCLSDSLQDTVYGLDFDATLTTHENNELTYNEDFCFKKGAWQALEELTAKGAVLILTNNVSALRNHIEEHAFVNAIENYEKVLEKIIIVHQNTTSSVRTNKQATARVGLDFLEQMGYIGEKKIMLFFADDQIQQVENMQAFKDPRVECVYACLQKNGQAPFLIPTKENEYQKPLKKPFLMDLTPSTNLFLERRMQKNKSTEKSPIAPKKAINVINNMEHLNDISLQSSTVITDAFYKTSL